MVDAARKRVNKARREMRVVSSSASLQTAGTPRRNAGTDTARRPVNTTRIEAVPDTRNGRAPGRFSTTVEKSVEISGLSGLTALKSLVVSGSAYGEGNFMAVLSANFGL